MKTILSIIAKLQNLATATKITLATTGIIVAGSATTVVIAIISNSQAQTETSQTSPIAPLKPHPRTTQYQNKILQLPKKKRLITTQKTIVKKMPLNMMKTRKVIMQLQQPILIHHRVQNLHLTTQEEYPAVAHAQFRNME